MTVNHAGGYSVPLTLDDMSIILDRAYKIPAHKHLALEFIRDMPKVDLHVHFAGSFFPNCVMHLLESCQSRSCKEEYTQKFGHPPSKDHFALQHKRSFQNFEEKFSRLYHVRSLVGESEFDHTMADCYVEYSARSNVIYSELAVGVLKSPLSERTISALSDALGANNPIRKSLRHNQTSTRLIASLRRCDCLDSSVASYVDRALSIYNNVKGVVGVGLHGDEQACRVTKDLKHALSKAAVPQTLHLGEFLGDEINVNDVDSMVKGGLRRVCHGTHLPIEVTKAMIDRNVHFSVSLKSNRMLNSVNGTQVHPVYRLPRKFYSLSTDDPALFETDLVEEMLEYLDGNSGVNPSHLIEMQLNAVGASFLPAADKGYLRSYFTNLMEEVFNYVFHASNLIENLDL